VRENVVAPLAGDYPTTADLIARGEADWRGAARTESALPLASLRILSPVTAPCRVFCQGANYRRHMIESGIDPDAKAFNMFFTKTDASISPPIGVVQRPKHVALLDYEIELALVFRCAVDAPVSVTPATLKDYVFAIAIANDLSARDVQQPQTQFFKGKSYRGFCPIGPWLTVLEPEEFAVIDQLDLRLAVNGAVRQSDSTANLVFKPAETISELSTFANIAPGDVLLTGTPSGCALRVPPPPVRRLAQLLPERQLWKLFLRSQARRREYLQPGDRINATIRSADGRFDLGEQITRVA
jgi:2-keto-4-pentenoate hydratase/2-oxohepta-3-ene-1,7-dioic acid hydratase in catechol pathway